MSLQNTIITAIERAATTHGLSLHPHFAAISTLANEVASGRDVLDFIEKVPAIATKLVEELADLFDLGHVTISVGTFEIDDERVLAPVANLLADPLAPTPAPLAPTHAETDADPIATEGGA